MLLLLLLLKSVEFDDDVALLLSVAGLGHTGTGINLTKVIDARGATKH